MQNVPLNIIMAYNNQHVIGKGDGLPWQNKRDLQYFKQVTIGQCVVFGYNTYIGIKDIVQRKMSNRLVIVVDRDCTTGYEYHPQYKHIIFIKNLEYIFTCENLKIQIMLHKIGIDETNISKIFIAGGLSLYNEMLMKYQDKIDNIYLTKINDDIVGTHVIGNEMAEIMMKDYYIAISDSHWSGDCRMILKPNKLLEHLQNDEDKNRKIRLIDKMRHKIITNEKFIPHYENARFTEIMSDVLNDLRYQHPLYILNEHSLLIMKYATLAKEIPYIGNEIGQDLQELLFS